jgi:hypothetical protein|tara:strand:- start:1724 stop:1948 length:225 start_codon:yes stop_codon:yes gene_type:complete
MDSEVMNSLDDEFILLPITEDEVPLAFEIYQEALAAIQYYFDGQDDEDAKFVQQIMSETQDKLCLLASSTSQEH